MNTGSKARSCEHCAATQTDVAYLRFEFEQLKRCGLFHDLEQKCRDLEKMRAELEFAKKEAEKYKNQYADFKQRMKYELSGVLDSSGARSENIMNPCRESELLQIYKRITTQSWRKTKDGLLQRGVPSSLAHEQTVMLIKSMLQHAVHYVNTQIKRFITNTCSVATVSGTASVQKIIHAFQIYFFNCDDAYYKRIVEVYVSQYYMEHREICIDFAAECYKLATLMLLHEPPLTPLWEEEQGQSFSFWPYTTNT